MGAADGEDRASAGEGRRPGGAREGEAAEAVDVGGRPDLLAPDRLGREVVGRPDQGTDSGQHGVLEPASDAEVRERRAGRPHEDIGRLHVPVQHAGAVEHVDRPAEPPDDVDQLVRLERRSLESGGEGAVRRERRDEVLAPVVQAVVENRDEVRMVERAGDRALPGEALPEHRVRIRVEHLDGDLASAGPPGADDRRRRAAAELLLDDVGPNPCAGPKVAVRRGGGHALTILPSAGGFDSGRPRWYDVSIPPRIGTDFAGYRIEALLGRGGSATVYRAEGPRLGIRVALKILNAEVAQDEAFRERFVRESALAAGINHPNVITIHDAGAWGDDLFIVLRYVPGGDLNVPLSQGPLEPARAVAILAQVASGLDAAHARGLVHRDVKPANVMLDAGPAEGAPEIAYVTDFGLTKHLVPERSATPTGDLLGTIAYVAPEQIEGRSVDGAADQYALGCVAFECLTGRVPFPRDNDAAVLWAHMKEDPPAAGELRPELPAGVDGVLARALAKDPARRFSSCLEFVEALRLALEPEARGAATVVLPRRLRRGGPGRRRLRVAALALAGAGLAALGVWAGTLMTDEVPGSIAAAEVETRTVVSTVVEKAPPALLASIPETFRARCRAAEAPTPDFDASVVCRPGRGVEFARFSEAVSNPFMTSYLARRLGAIGLPVPGEHERIAFVGSCEGRVLPAVEEWAGVGRAGHDPIGRTQFSDSGGHVVCYQQHDRAHLEWTSKDLGIYAHAYGPNYRALLRWWMAEGGPIT